MNTITEAVRAEVAGFACETQCSTEDILKTLHDRIGSQKFNAWFRHGIRLGIEENLVKVSVPNPFVGNWIETHYQADISAAVESHTGQKLPVMVTIDTALGGQILKSQLDCQAQMVQSAASGRSREKVPVSSGQTLRHKLDDFVVGESNRLAYSAAMAVVGQGPSPFNPLFIHGSCGVGKTHLLQGICGIAQKTRHGGNPLKWRYVSGEQFTNEFITSLRQKKIDEFRARYRSLDLLAIDDVHFLASKKATQEEFLHTFNTIASAGKQIVMVSDAHPRMVGELNEQLISRFVAGMVVKVNAPDQSMRMEILKRRAAKMSLTVPQDVLEYVAMHIRGSVRELEGALLKVSAVAALNSGCISLATASDALADHLARTDSAITLGDIEAAVAAYFGITPADIHSSRRIRTVSLARRVAMFLARRHTRMSYPEIGTFMGKNHSSVVLSVQKMEQLLAGDEQVEWMTPMGQKQISAKKLLELLTEQFT